MKKYLSKVILVVCILYVVIPLLQKRFIPTHDGEYHIIRFWEFDRMITGGQLLPRWASDFDKGFGSPVFIYQYVLPNYIGVLFHHIGFSYIQSVEMVLLTGYVIACLSCYLWLKKLFSDSGAIIGTAVFAFVPYWFVDIYIRGSVGEVLALGFSMASLASIEYKKNILLSLFITLLLLSHNIAAMVCIPFVFVYTLIRKKILIPWIFLGFGLASFFWIPAIFEQKFVAGLNTVRYQDHFVELYQLLFPSWGTGFSGSTSDNQMSFQIGVIPIFSFIIFSFLSIFRNKRSNTLLSFLFICIFFVSICMTTAASDFIWRMVPLLSYIQHPWRFLIFIPIASAYFAGSIGIYVKKQLLIWIMIIGSFVTIRSYARPVTYEPREDSRYIHNVEWNTGTSTMGNTLHTIWEKQTDTRKSQAIFFDGNGDIEKLRSTPTEHIYKVSAVSSGLVQLPVNYFPGWEAYVNKKKESIGYKTNGLIELSLLPGTSDIRIVFGSTPTRLVGAFTSIICLLTILASGILEVIYANRNRRNTT